MKHPRVAPLGFAVLAVALAACPSSTGSPQERAAESSSAARSGSSRESSSLGAAPSAATCPIDAPVICPRGCCPAGSTCAPADLFDGGECLSTPATFCPAGAPVQCGGGPSCDGGVCALVDQSSFHNDASLRFPAVFADGRASGAVGLSAGCDDVSAPAAGLPTDGGAYSNRGVGPLDHSLGGWSASPATPVTWRSVPGTTGTGSCSRESTPSAFAAAR